MDGTANERITYCSAGKDQTDLEIAINWALEQKPALIRIFGATGGRLDHGLANIQMLLKGLEVEIEMCIVDNKNEITVKKWVHI